MKLHEIKIDHKRAHQPADDIMPELWIAVPRGTLWQRDLHNVWVFPTAEEAAEAPHTPAGQRVLYDSNGKVCYMLPITSGNGIHLLLQIDADAYQKLRHFHVLGAGPTKMSAEKAARGSIPADSDNPVQLWVYKTWNSDTSIFDLDEEDLSEDLGNPTTIQLEKGLTYKEALKACPWKKSYGDCRAFAYDAKTGKAVWT